MIAEAGNLGVGAAEAVNKWLIDLGMAENLDQAYHRQKQGGAGASQPLRERRHSLDSDDCMTRRGSANSFTPGLEHWGVDSAEPRGDGSADFIASCLFCVALYAVVQLLIFFESVFVPFMVALFLM